MSVRARLSAVIASQPRVYWIVWWGTLINRLGTFVMPLLTIYLTTVRGISVTEAGAVISASGVGSILASIVGGHLADRVGRRFTMMLSLFSGAAVMVVLGQLEDVTQITICLAVLGFTADTYRPAVSAFVSDVVPEPDRLRAYGLLYWAVNLGWAFAAAIGGVIATHSFSLLFYIDAGTMAAFGVIVAIAVPETRPPRVVATPARPAPLVGPPWWRDRVFAVFCGLNFLLILLPYQTGATLSAHMTMQGFSPAAYGAVLACNGALIVVAQPWITGRMARYDGDRILVAAAMLYGIGLAVHGVATVLAVHMLGALIWTTAEILESPTRSAMIAAMAPADQRGRYQGAFVMMWGGGALVASRLGTRVWDEAGPRVLWFGCLGLGTFVAIAMAATARERRARVAADIAAAAAATAPGAVTPAS